MPSQLVRGLNFGGELFAFPSQGAEIALDLEAVPELGGLLKKCSEADRHGRRDGPATQYDFVDRPRRDADGPGHGVLRYAHGR